MATKKFPSEMSSRGTVLGTDKILIYNATTGASDEVCTVAELLKMLTDIYPLTGLTTGKVPYKSATVLADSPIHTDGTRTSFGGTALGAVVEVIGGLATANNRTLRLSAASSPVLELYTDNVSANARNWAIAGLYNEDGTLEILNSTAAGGVPATSRLAISKDGNVIIAATTGSYNLTLANDSAGKPGAGGLWTVVSDARIKKDIELADLDICYDTIKNIPLKRYAWADGVYSEGQVPDRHNLGWIAQDVQKYFSKAVTVKPFTKNEKIEDGVEEYQEQDFVIEDKKVTSIEMVNGSPIQVTKTVQEKVLLFDEVEVKDELGKVVLENGKPLLYKVPKMITKTRPKFRQEVIEDCLDLNSGQLNAALYGAVQACMLKIESLEKEIALLKQ